MPLVIVGLKHHMWDLRREAIKISVLLFQACGDRLLPYFREVPRNLIETLNKEFAKADLPEQWQQANKENAAEAGGVARLNESALQKVSFNV